MSVAIDRIDQTLRRIVASAMRDTYEIEWCVDDELECIATSNTRREFARHRDVITHERAQPFKAE
jgi:hypothetical protein